MTVKELKKILDECEDDYLDIVIFTDEDGSEIILDVELKEPDNDLEDDDFANCYKLVATELY